MCMCHSENGIHTFNCYLWQFATEVNRIAGGYHNVLNVDRS